MERNANYALVGVVSLSIFMGLVIFIVWLARIHFAHDYTIYDVVFVGPISGLSQGGEVHFNGIKVGEVTTIGLDKKDPRDVIARVRITSDVPVRADSIATLEPLGITGVTYIQITAGTASQPMLKDTAGPGQIPIIHSRTSALSGLLEGGGTVLNAAVETLQRVNRILSDDNIKSVHRHLAECAGRHRHHEQTEAAVHRRRSGDQGHRPDGHQHPDLERQQQSAGERRRQTRPAFSRRRR